MSQACFHCGDPLPPHPPPPVNINGEDRPVCCSGCAAVATLIAGAGLEDFYRYRTATAPRPDPSQDTWNAWDSDKAQQPLVRRLNNGQRELVLLIEGIRCSACGWLIEKVLGRMSGIEGISVNPASARAVVRWNPEQVALSAILRKLDHIGYQPHPLAPGERDTAALREQRAAVRRLAVAGLGMMQVMMYAVGLYAGTIHAGMDPQFETLLRWISAIVATPVALYAAFPFYRGAVRDIRAGRPGMDVPVSLAIGGAYTFSVWHVFIGHGEVYFDSVTMFTFFLTIARFLELMARQRAGRASMALGRLLPATALRLTTEGEERVALSALAPGDRLRVRPGEAIPTDGQILSGRTHVDESLLTGESMPQARQTGDQVIGGSTNTNGAIEIEVTQVGADTVVASVMRLLERAQAERPPIARLADQVARVFVIVLLIAASITGAIWLQIAPERAFEITLAVLVVTCPCALSLATPAALVNATGRLARDGLLVARADAIERLVRIRHVVFDKTGTLTAGRIRLTRTQCLGEPIAEECIAIAAAMEAEAGHPLARAFDGLARHPGIHSVESHSGLGVEALLAGQKLRLGRPDWVCELSGTDNRAAAATAAAASTVVLLGNQHQLIARFELTDALRGDAAEAIRDLRAAGIRVSIASGDAAPAVAAIAEQLNVDDWQAGLDPAAKLALLEQYRQDCPVAMVGDGINDAPVLAGADVAVALGSGAAIAHGNADLLLAGERLTALAPGIAVAKRTRRIIRQNLLWAASYNASALPLAAMGMIPPWAAALGMSASSLLVVGNALRLSRAEKKHRQENRAIPPVSAIPRAAS